MDILNIHPNDVREIVRALTDRATEIRSAAEQVRRQSPSSATMALLKANDLDEMAERIAHADAYDCTPDFEGERVTARGAR